MKQGMMNAVCIVGAAMWLAACSGSGDGGTGGGTPVAAPALTGVFVDAPVGGLSYTSSSGLRGTTNSQGQFSYRSGDIVVFSYGQTVLGGIPAVPQVTPWTVISLNSPDPTDPRWINMARLLQTFNNVLPPVTPTIAALPPIDFFQADAAFAADPNVAALLNAMGSSPAALVSGPQAITTLQSQFALLGSWFAQNTTGPNFIVFTAMADGTFMISEDGSNDPAGVDGMERGIYTWDPATGVFTATVQRDTNNQNGISHTPGPYTITITGNSADFTSGNGLTTFTRVVDTTAPVNPLVGAWRFLALDDVQGSLAALTIFEDGTFVLVGDEALPTSDGIERGTYVVGSGNDVTLTRTIDTSTTAGFFDPAGPVTVTVNVVVNGDTMVITNGPVAFTGTRIRPPQ